VALATRESAIGVTLMPKERELKRGFFDSFSVMLFKILEIFCTYTDLCIVSGGFFS
jgi:hypothetical protein